MRIGAAYIRVSTDDQLEFSPDSQVKKIREYAKANDIVLSNDFIFMEDEGKSGRNASKRPEFQRMISIAKSKPKPFDVILVWKFSRFARNREDSVVYKSMLRKQCKIDIVSVSENIGDDKVSILIEAIIEAMDEWYSINLAEEVVRGMAEKASRGGVVASPAFGYRVENGRYVPDPERAEIVRLIFDKFVNSDIGYHGLASMLNAIGVRTRKGGLMENRTVEYILRNPVYIGKIRWNTDGNVRKNRNFESPDDIIADGDHEPLISVEMFEQAREKAAEKKRHYKRYVREQNQEAFLLKGLVKCSACGSTLIRSRDGLQCHSYAKGSCKVSHYISINQINERVIKLITKDLQGQSFHLMLTAPAQYRSQGDFIEKKIQHACLKLERIRAAYADGIDTLAEYKSNKQTILAEIAHLENSKTADSDERLAERKQDFFNRIPSIISQLNDPTFPEHEKNHLLHTFVDRIVFNRHNNKISVFYYLG